MSPGLGTTTSPTAGRWWVTFEDVVRVHDDGQVHLVATRKALALLVVLVIDGSTSRSHLARLLWPDVAPDAARRNLRREVYRWRQAGLPLQDLDGQRLGLAAGAVAVDRPPGRGRWVEPLIGVAGEDFDDWLAQHVGATPAATSPAPRGPWRAAPLQESAAADIPAPGAPPFVARVAWLRAIDDAWAAGRSVVLAGPPGIGKTRLALEAAARHGAVLHVAARPEDADAPFAAAIRGLRALREAAPDVALPSWVVETLAVVMPDWAPDGSAPIPPGDDWPARLAAAGAMALRRLAADNFNVLVFDDWQWVDAESARWWIQLDAADPAQASAEPLPLRLVAHRVGALQPAVLAHLRSVCDSGQAVRLVLDDWSLDEVGQLVAGGLGTLAPDLAMKLHASTGGHPLFVLETLRWLQATGQLSAAGTEAATPATLRLPPSVHDAVRARVHALGAVAAEVLQAASLAVPPLRARALAAITGVAVDAVEAVLAHATAAGLLVDGGAGLRFTHDMVRESLGESTPVPRRERWHAAWAVRAAADGAAPAQVATHWDAAGDATAGREWHVRAAEQAQRMHALPQALMHWRAALAVAPATAAAVPWWLQCADVLARLDDVAGADAALREAALAADAVPPLRRRVRALQAQLWARSGRLDDAEALLAQVQPDAGDGLHPVLTVTAAEIAQRRGQLDRAVALCSQAAAQWPDEPGALPAIADALHGVARAAAQSGDFATGQQACERGLALLRAVDAPAVASALLSMLGVVQIWRGQRDAARETLVRAADAARRGGHPNTRRMALLNLAKLHSDAGEIAACLSMLDELDRLPPAADAVRGELFVAQVRWFAGWLAGDLAACRAQQPRLLALAEATADAYARLSTLQLVVDLPLLCGDLAEAGALLERAQTDPGLPQAGPIRTMVDNKRAWWLLRAGRPADALALLANAAPADLDEARLLRTAVQAGALRALGRPEEALGAVQAVALEADGSGDALARWLAEWWRCAHATGVAPPPAMQTATHALLAGMRAPAVDRQALRDAMAGGQTSTGSAG
ncbi:MAG: AAA family ATPase [Burkholderiaceae bacterium]|nr:AAA family ATPase [Burkholderiaceae bacterium]